MMFYSVKKIATHGSTYVFQVFTEASKFTTPATYRVILAGFVKLFGISSVGAVRFYSFVVSFLSVPVFYLVARKIDPASPGIRTLQYGFLPIVFQFFFLIYTDIPALLCLLLSLYFVLGNKPSWSAFWGLAALLIRQNSIPWLFLFFLLIYLADNGFSFTMEKIKRHLEKNWFFLLIFILFIGFVIANHGVALGDRDMHPFPSFHMGNVYFSLFFFFFMFLPLNLSNAKDIWRHLRRDKFELVVLTAFFFFYFFTFREYHPYNYCFGFVRNHILYFLSSSPLRRTLFFLPVAYSVLSLRVTKFTRSYFYFLYPVTALYLMPSWLIEPRYYIVPFVLFELFREKRSASLEFSTLICFLIFSGWLFYNLIMLRFFL